jgi:hypothetical protein
MSIALKQFVKRDPSYVRGEVCAHKWSVEDGPMPSRYGLKKCGKPAVCGIPMRMEGNQLVPCLEHLATGDAFLCEEHSRATLEAADTIGFVRLPNPTAK